VTENAKQRFSMKAAGPEVEPSSTDPADWCIRANQGHSLQGLDSEALHTPLTLDNLPPVVVHGTYFAFWPRIVESGGLRRMGRTHVHFGTGLPEDGTPSVADGPSALSLPGGAAPQVHDVADEEPAAGRPKVISGMRSDAEVLVFVDVAQSLCAGDMKWWLSANGVVLTEGDADGVVPLRYFREVRGRRQRVGLLWKDGAKVADLPDDVVARVPQGKEATVGRGANRGGGRGGRGGRRGGGRS
jgi:2'-phosphotransferase